MRAPRLLSLLLILQNRGHRTAAELAEELGVSVRTIYRDLEALGEAGVPVVAERGPGGGCRLMNGYRTRLTGLSPREADALFLAGAPAAAAELGLGGVLAAAQRKVLASLPERLRDAAALAQQRFHLDPRPWFREVPEHPELPAVAGAVWADRRIAFEYRRDARRGDSAPVQREAEPLGLVLKAGLWYLVARVDAEPRSYRVSRMAKVRVSEVGFERDPAFDLSRFWAGVAEAFPRDLPAFPVRVRVAPAARPRLAKLGEPVRRAGPEAHGAPDRAGWTRHALVFERLEYALSALLPFGGELEVIDPPELRDALLRTARAIQGLYGQDAIRLP